VAPIAMIGATVQINPLLDAASCAVAYAKGLLWHGRFSPGFM